MESCNSVFKDIKEDRELHDVRFTYLSKNNKVLILQREISNRNTMNNLRKIMLLV